MTVRLALIFAATSLASAGALAQEQAAPEKAAPAEAEAAPPKVADEVRQFVESCPAHKFETTVEVTVEGKKRGRKVTLCGKEGQSDADWVLTLKDAAGKIEADPKMTPAMKFQIVTALKTEIARIEANANAGIKLPDAAIPPAQPPVEYAVVPEMPPPKPAEPAALPAPPVAVAASTTAPASTPAATRRNPRLTIRCIGPRQSGGGSTCVSLEEDTMLTIRADEALSGGASLRFLRRGDARGRIALARMAPGQTIRARLPEQLCSGVASSRVEIQVLDDGEQVVQSLGPYRLRC